MFILLNCNFDKKQSVTSIFFLIILEFESLSVYVFLFWSFCFSFCDLHIRLNCHLSLWCSPQCYWFVSTLYIYSERLNPTTLRGRGYLSASGPHFSFRTRLLICLLFVKLRMGKAINYNYLWMFPGQINQPNTCSAWRELSHIRTHTWRDFIKLTVRKTRVSPPWNKSTSSSQVQIRLCLIYTSELVYENLCF